MERLRESAGDEVGLLLPGTRGATRAYYPQPGIVRSL